MNTWRGFKGQRGEERWRESGSDVMGGGGRGMKWKERGEQENCIKYKHYSGGNIRIRVQLRNPYGNH